MLLFRGVEAYRPRSQFLGEDEYSAHLHSLNEQVSWILRLKRDIFASHLETSSLQHSLVLLIVATFHHLARLSPPVLVSEEDWHGEYQQILENELVLRVIKLTDRLLVTAPAMLLRTVDLPHWIQWWSGMVKNAASVSAPASNLTFVAAREGSLDGIIFRMMRTLFRVGIVARKQAVLLLSTLDVAILKDHDLLLVTMIISAAEVRVEEELAAATVAEVLLEISGQEDLVTAAQCLWYLSQHRCWDSSDSIKSLTTALHQAPSNATRLLVDMLNSTVDLSRLQPLASALTTAMEERDKIDAIIAAVPSMSLESAGAQLRRYNGNAQQVISNASSRDQGRAFARMLDDKSFVHAHMDKFRATLLEESVDERVYEDEYVDSFDESLSMDKHRASDSLSSTDVELMRVYAKDPALFNRKAQTRQSVARKSLLQKLQMSHEQLEGWALMLERNVSFLDLWIINYL